MAFGDILRFSDILKATESFPDLKAGLLVDTSILYAESYPYDEFHDPAVELFEFLHDLKIPVFTNLNIRAEFLDQHRRATIAEGLTALYTLPGASADPNLYKILKRIAERARLAVVDQKPIKVNDREIKEARDLLKKKRVGSTDGWLAFCNSYLVNNLELVWPETCDNLGINFFPSGKGDKTLFMKEKPEWDDMERLMARYGLASFDAMILNLFLNSKFLGIITADKDIAYAMAYIKPEGKFAVIPDKLSL